MPCGGWTPGLTGADHPTLVRYLERFGGQPDPPISIFQDVSSLPSPAARAFTPLADQRWVTIALSYLKEVDAISLRRGDLAAKKPAPPLPPKGPGEAEALSKKQQRAAAWAAKRASAKAEK